MYHVTSTHLSALDVRFLAVFPRCVEVVQFEAEWNKSIKQRSITLRYVLPRHRVTHTR